MSIFGLVLTSSATSLHGMVALLSVTAWPLLVLGVLIWLHKPIYRLVNTILLIAESSNTFKVWQIEFSRDVEGQLKGTAAAARNTPPIIINTQQEITSLLPVGQLEAASRVQYLLQRAPTSTLRASALEGIREQMLALAQEYVTRRAGMAPGSERTREMNVIAAKMRTLGLAAQPFVKEFSENRYSPGVRLAAIMILQMSPDLSYASWLAERVRVEQPFVFYQAAVALLTLVREYGRAHMKELHEPIAQAVQTLKSYSGEADRNTFHTLNLALQELERCAASPTLP